MQHVANIGLVHDAPANAAIEVAGLSHTYAGRDGAVPALTDISLSVGAGRFVVIMSATAAVESVKADHVLVARSYGATRMQILTRVYVPSMMPILLETLRISMIFNFTGVMIAEMYASRTGIGHLISNWGENFQLPQLFAGVILLAAVAITFNETVRFLESRCSTWRT